MCLSCKAPRICHTIHYELQMLFETSHVKKVCFQNKGLFCCYITPDKMFNYETFKNDINSKTNCQYHSIVRKEYNQRNETVEIYVRYTKKN